MNLKTKIDDFGTEDTYKLYRTIYEILHPTISKKNISNYKIIIQENLIPLRIFYPKKISKIDKIIIYIHGQTWITNGRKNYTEVCSEIVKETNSLLIALDYELKTKYEETLKECYETIEYLYQGLERIEIKKENIILMGDSIGASILANISMGEKNLPIEKLILLYPALNLTFENIDQFPSIEQNNKLDLLTVKHLLTFKKKYIDKTTYKSPLQEKIKNNFPKTLMITGDLDPLRDEGKEFYNKLKKDKMSIKYVNIKFASHGFLNSKDEESIEECLKEINKFI